MTDNDYIKRGDVKDVLEYAFYGEASFGELLEKIDGIPRELIARELLLRMSYRSKCSGHNTVIKIAPNFDETDIAEYLERLESAFPEIPREKRKTYAEDFLEKFPKAEIKDGVPDFCRSSVYGPRKCAWDDDCTVCWNQEMEDEHD